MDRQRGSPAIAAQWWPRGSASLCRRPHPGEASPLDLMVVEGVRSIPDTEGKMQSFKVTGMTCAHCVRAVTDAVRGVDAAADVKVDLA